MLEKMRKLLAEAGPGGAGGVGGRVGAALPPGPEVRGPCRDSRSVNTLVCIQPASRACLWWVQACVSPIAAVTLQLFVCGSSAPQERRRAASELASMGLWHARVPFPPIGDHQGGRYERGDPACAIIAVANAGKAANIPERSPLWRRTIRLDKTRRSADRRNKARLSFLISLMSVHGPLSDSPVIRSEPPKRGSGGRWES